MLNYFVIIKLIKKYFSDFIQKRCLEDPIYAKSLHSQNYIGLVLVISFCIKIAVWSIIILNLSYIIGMGWLIMCQFVDEFIHGPSNNDIQKLK